MKYLGRLLLLGFVLVGAAGYCAAKLEQDNFEYNKTTFQKLAKKFDNIDLIKSDLDGIKKALGELISNKTERPDEPHNIKYIGKAGPINVVADFDRALNIVENIEGLTSNDRTLLKTRLSEIRNIVSILKNTPSKDMVEKLKKINTYAQFSVPSQTTPKAMFNGVNAISKAAESFFKKLEDRAYVEIYAERLPDLIKKLALVTSAEEFRDSVYNNLRVDLLVKHIKELQKKTAESIPYTALKKINNSLESAIRPGITWENLCVAVANGGRINAADTPEFISQDNRNLIAKSWNDLAQTFVTRANLEILATRIESKFSEFGSRSKEAFAKFMEALKIKIDPNDFQKYLKEDKKSKEAFATFMEALKKIKTDANDVQKYLDKELQPKLVELSDKLTPLINSDTGNVKGTLGGITKNPIKRISSPKGAIGNSINRIVDTFNKSVQKLVEQMEGMKQ